VEVRFGLPGPAPPATGPPVVATVGNFDGVHLGHQRVVAALRDRAAAAGAATLVVVFEPHPRAVLTPAAAPQLITTPDARRGLLAGLGVDRLQVVEFDHGVSRLGAEVFLDRLHGRHRLVGLVVGPGFAMGFRRHGTAEVLAAHGARRGYRVETLAAVADGDRRVSSTLVRERIVAGDVRGAARLLDRPFGLTGVVVHGEHIATGLGFPTANLRLRPEQLLPAFGIYAMWARRVGGPWGPAVGNVGVRPHFGTGPVVVEVHCGVPPGDLYGERLQAVFVERLRPEARFSSDAALRRQIAADVDAAGRLLAASEPPRADAV